MRAVFRRGFKPVLMYMKFVLLFFSTVESLIMSNEMHEGSRGRAQKILDLLTVKGQELTVGNQSKYTI